jgi:hypothetical protein
MKPRRPMWIAMLPSDIVMICNGDRRGLGIIFFDESGALLNLYQAVITP